MGRTLKQLKESGDIQLGSEFLTAEDKVNIVAGHVPFTLVGVGPGKPGRWGPRWQVDIILDGNPRSLTFGHGDWRDEQMEMFKEALADGPIHQVTLVKIGTTDNGQPILSFDQAD